MAAAVLAAGLVTAAPARAAVEFGRAVIGNTVQSRTQPGYEPIGIRAGSFMFFPTLDVRGEYNDNIYADRVGKVDDFIVDLKPQIMMKSLWMRHSLRVSAYGDFGLYTTHSTENYQDAGVNTDANFEIAENSTLSAHLGAVRDHERRDSPDDARGVNPTVYYRVTPELRFDQRINRFAFRLRGAVDYLNFNNAVTGTGAIIDENDRDRLTWTMEGRAGYDVAKNVQVYVSGLIDRRRYDQRFDDQGVSRNSNGFGVFGGIIIELTGTLSGETYLGYRRQNFSDPSLIDITGVAGGVNLIWAPTKLTTVTLTGERTIEETTVVGSTASLNTNFNLTIDHELRRNVIITLMGGYNIRQYEGINRDDNTWRGSLSVQYLLNRHFRLRAGYSYNSRRSDTFLNGYDTNSVYVNLHVDY